MGVVHMSVINQVLLDLEKRRASDADRSVLPDHVRALPEMRQGPRFGLISLISGLAAVTGVAAWFVLPGFRLPDKMQPLPVSQAAATPQNRIVAATPSSGVAANAPLREDPAPSVAAVPGSRPDVLSLELARSLGMASDSPRRADERPEFGAPIATAEVVVAQSEPAPEARARPSKVEKPAPKATVVAAVKPEAGSTPAAPPEIDKRVRPPTARQQAESEYAKATVLLHQGQLQDARELFEAALRHYPAHLAARQALFGLLVEAGDQVAAERVLREALRLSPDQTGFTMALARLEVDRGHNQAAIDTLQKGIAHAQSNADYHAFLGALLQRQQQHDDAVGQFRAALSLKPQSGLWLMGLGMSLQALHRNTEAGEAFRRAKSTGTLKPELQAFVDQRLQQLQ
jgi:MSHA biogenesis protein MshN